MELVLIVICLVGVWGGQWLAADGAGTLVLSAGTAMVLTGLLAWVQASGAKPFDGILLVFLLPLFVGLWIGWIARRMAARRSRSAHAPRPE